MADGLFTRLNNINKQRFMNEAAQEEPKNEEPVQPQEEAPQEPEQPQEPVNEEPEQEQQEPNAEQEEQPQEEPKEEEQEEPKNEQEEQPINEEEVTIFMCEDCGELYESECTCECGGELYEAVKVVVRDGKVQKKKVNRKKKRLSAAQKAALAKARKKAHSSSAAKARAKSMKVRNKKIKEAEDFHCPECDYVGEMEEIEEGVFLCPDCKAELEVAEEQTQACDVKDGQKCEIKDKNEEVTPIAEGLKIYLEALEVPQEVIDEGQDAVVGYLKAEYGVDPTF